MRIHPIVTMVLIAALSTGAGVAAGYSIGRNNQDALTETAGIPVQYLASVSPPALRASPSDHFECNTPDDSPRPRYVLGTDHGFVAVFYIQDDLNQTLALKERTLTPETALSTDDRKRLDDGIYIYTEEQLIRLLQDYGS